jgi:hypothetical protein
MALNVWTQPSGISLGSFPEEDAVDIALPVTNDSGVTYTVISGSLPGGLYISGNHLIGNPYIVANNTTYTFCIRAKLGSSIADRSFFITVTGHNIPMFITAPGGLPVGPSKQLYTLDSMYVSYQIETLDLNVAVGQKLTYFIGTDDGALPNGLTLSPSGLISGFVEPVLKITPASGNGTYDDTFFDVVAYDFGSRPSDGFDSYHYDDVFYDYNLGTALPTTLNANYQFKVTVTDGVNYAQRLFKIFVVGTDQFRADSTSFNGIADGFTSDATYLRTPVWINNSNLGIFRSSNYLTVPLALYDNLDVLFRVEPTNQEVYAVTYQVENTDNNIGGFYLTVGNVNGVPLAGQYLTFDNYLDGATGRLYEIQSVTNLLNNNVRLHLYSALEMSIPNGVPFYIGSLSHLPPGVSFDIESGNLYGQLPYQPAITKTYTFTITGTRLGDHITETLNASKTFTITVIGNIDNVITWNTPDDLGTIPANYICTLAVSASTTVPNASVLYQLESFETIGSSGNGILSTIYFSNQAIAPFKPGQLIVVADMIPVGYNGVHRVASSTTGSVSFYNITQGNQILPGTVSLNGLPPGLTLNLDGEITGTVNQYYNATTGAVGLTTFDNGHVTFDRNTSTIDRVFEVAITARDQYNYSSTTKNFKITVSTPNAVAYSNILTRPYLKAGQRLLWNSFIDNPTIFPPTSVYRPNDKNFGIQSTLTMLVYAGIQTREASAYVGAMGLNHKQKRFRFGSVKKAVAIDPNLNQSVYEVVYIQMIDPLENNGKHLPERVVLRPGVESDRITVDNSTNFYSSPASDENFPDTGRSNRDVPKITVDNTGYQISNPNPDAYFPNSISNWQKRLSRVGLSERNYLPLWMRSIPTGEKQQLGYTLSIPLCFCKPGTADAIITNIKFSGFDFKSIDYTVDRYIIDSVMGDTGDKYLVFKNDRITV